MDDQPTVECEVCGGTDFYKESGYYYCNECQTQTQEIKEHVFEQDITTIHVGSTRKIKQTKAEKTDNKITSWECYNIVLLALTEELINLGADKNLKLIVKCLWLRYLNKIQVFSLKTEEPPKLEVIGSRRQIKILYGLKRRRRKSRSSSESASTTTNTSSRRERSKKKRALAQSQYDEFSLKSTHGSSLHNETLTSLKSSSDKNAEQKKSQLPKFNTYNTKILRKSMTVAHLRKHRMDFENKLTCHKFSSSNLPQKFTKGPSHLSINKLYCILYIGLLIIQDKIQLGDLFRFIREGHLSFNNYLHLFPEGYAEKHLNMCWKKSASFSIQNFKIATADLAKFLKVVRFIQTPNLVKLSKRYCQELNLPDEVHFHVRNLISKTTPSMKFSQNHKHIPNYEGRVVSLIILVLKLLFGLDGATEFHFSNYSKKLNNIIYENKMFDIADWLKYIGYREKVMTEYHFPTSYSKGNVDSDLFLTYMLSQGIKYTENAKLTREMKDYKHVLTQMNEMQEEIGGLLKFPPSLTPFLDYVQIIRGSRNKIHREDVLRQIFTSDSLDFLVRPNKYLKLLGNEEVKNGGANENIIIEKLTNLNNENFNKYYANKKIVAVQLTKSGNGNCTEFLSKASKKDIQTDPKIFLSNWQTGRELKFKKNRSYLRKVSKEVELDEDNIETEEYYKEHFNPFERYWLYFWVKLNLLNKENFNEQFEKLPHTFKTIFKECMRIIEQDQSELYDEYQMTEAFFAFAATYMKQEPSNCAVGKEIRSLVKSAVDNW